MNIFINKAEERPRAGWRLLMQLILAFILTGIISLVRRSFIASPLHLYDAVATLIGVCGSIWLAAILLDRRPFNEFGISLSPIWKKELWTGLGMGSLAMGFIFLLEWVFGWISFNGFGWERLSQEPYIVWIFSYLVAMVCVGIYEELLFRGYQILNLSEGFCVAKLSPSSAALAAVAVSSSAFGIMHITNPGATLFSTINIVIAGVVLAVPYLATGRLGFSIGIHISWNFLQGGIFGFAVSGMPFRGSLLQMQQNGPAWLTGGGFGPEAGLLGMLGLLSILLLFHALLKYKGQTWAISPLFIKPYQKSGKTPEQGS